MNNDNHNYRSIHDNHYHNNNTCSNNNTLYVLVRLVRYAGKDRTMPQTENKIK